MKSRNALVALLFVAAPAFAQQASTTAPAKPAAATVQTSTAAKPTLAAKSSTKTTAKPVAHRARRRHKAVASKAPMKATTDSASKGTAKP